MKTHVTLVNPPSPPGAVTHLPFAVLGLGYLAAVLERNHYEVDVIDCQVLDLSFEEFRREIGKRCPDVVGVTSQTLTYKSALRIIEISKEVYPDCLTVLGGCHVTFWDQKALQACPSLDVVVRKEGEKTFLELVQRLEEGKKLHDVLGTTCRKGGEIVKNQDRPYIEDLDSLPFPARHLWPMERLQEQEDVLYLMTSRGCTYWCEFCTTVRMHGRKYRTRSTENIVDELEFLNKKYDAKEFTFCDDVFTVDQARTEELCDEIMDRNLDIEWNCGTRVDMLTKGLLQKMKEAGCISVWFGVESGSQRVLDAMRKGISTHQTEQVLGWVRELGMKPVPNVVLGFPGETKETAWKTIKFVEKISPDEVGFYNIATPFPGTPLYEKVKKEGWLRVTEFDRYDTTTPIFETPWLSMEELRKLREQAFHHFYLRPEYFLDKKRALKFSTILKVLPHLLATIKLRLDWLTKHDKRSQPFI